MYFQVLYLSIEVKLGELPEETYVDRKEEEKEKNTEFKIESLGLTIANVSDGNGVTIINLETESNLLIGDIITEVNREIILKSDDFISLVDKIKETGRNSLLLKIIRDEQSLWVTIKFLK